MRFICEPTHIYAAGDDGKMLAEVTLVPHENDVVEIEHTFVDDTLRGQGIAGQILQATADYLREQGKKAWCTCSYAGHWYAKHPGYQTADPLG